jgi:hypothetical protein
VLRFLYALSSTEHISCESICFNAIEAKKDLLPSCVFWRFSYTKTKNF